MNHRLLFSWNLLLWFYFCFVALFLLGGSITFGHGLGDLGVLIQLVLLLLAYGVILAVLSMKRFTSRRRKGLIVTGMLTTLLALYVTYGFTLGRGAERAWDGNVLVG